MSVKIFIPTSKSFPISNKKVEKRCNLLGYTICYLKGSAEYLSVINRYYYIPICIGQVKCKVDALRNQRVGLAHAAPPNQYKAFMFFLLTGCLKALLRIYLQGAADFKVRILPSDHQHAKKVQNRDR